jgi:hypothetical protein
VNEAPTSQAAPRQENTDLTRIIKDLTEAIHHMLVDGGAKSSAKRDSAV